MSDLPTDANVSPHDQEQAAVRRLGETLERRREYQHQRFLSFQDVAYRLSRLLGPLPEVQVESSDEERFAARGGGLIEVRLRDSLHGLSYELRPVGTVWEVLVPPPHWGMAAVRIARTAEPEDVPMLVMNHLAARLDPEA